MYVCLMSNASICIHKYTKHMQYSCLVNGYMYVSVDIHK